VKKERNPPRDDPRPTESPAAPVNAPSSANAAEPIRAASTDSSGPWARLKDALAKPVDGGSLAVFRIAVGLIMVLEAIVLTRPSVSANGTVPLETYYAGSDIRFNLPYAGFEWLPLLPPAWMWAAVWILGISGLLVALGLFHRASAATLFLTWGYLYAVECTRTYWMSHYYLVLLMTFLLVWMPAARRYSLDARFFGDGGSTIPFWPVFLLRGQLVITYFYAGVAKLNADWLLDAEPVRYFLQQPHVRTPFASVNEFLRTPGFAYFIAYSGAIFDLAVGFLLLFRRTRLPGILLMCVFHWTNHFLLFEDIGFFPLLGVATALIFLSPDWPARFRAWTTGGRRERPLADNLHPVRVARAIPVFVVLWLGWQSVFPLRHWLIPGDARITFEGLSFSWRLKAEVYRTMPLQIRLRDPGVFPPADEQGQTIDWRVWQGDRVIYRQLPNPVDWSQLPEIVAVHDPIIGDRVIYNPQANPEAADDLAARATELWKELYGRAPPSMQPMVPLTRAIAAFEKAWINRGGAANLGQRALLEVMLTKFGPKGDGQMVPMLRMTFPFELLGRAPQPARFLLIEDPLLLTSRSNGVATITRDAWRTGPATQPPNGERYTHLGGEPLILHTVELNLDTFGIFPAPSIFDSQTEPGEPPFIAWNYMDDVTVSKAVHIGMQPFLLRRYARRVADLWEAQYGRRPAVSAHTAVSLNGRPVQPVVDPRADLASVPVRWFGHNDWILDLEEPRIPRDRVLPGFLGVRMGGN
jgi:vitamin K-dependent gamma-carboxylase